MYERFLTYFAARDWDAAEMLADDISTDDRRRVVNAGLRQGREAAIAEILAIAEVGVTNLTSTVIATRGGRLVLVVSASRAGPAEAFHDEVLNIVEIDADDRFAAHRRSTLTTSMPPSKNSKPGISQAKRRPTRTPGPSSLGSTPHSIGANIPGRRRTRSSSTTGGWVSRPGDVLAYIDAIWDLAPDIKILHRGRASAETPRSGRHPCRAWDLAR